MVNDREVASLMGFYDERICGGLPTFLLFRGRLGELDAKQGNGNLLLTQTPLPIIIVTPGSLHNPEYGGR